MKLNVDKVYCCHHPSQLLSPRKIYLNKFFEDNNIDVEWVEEGTPEQSKSYDNSKLLDVVMREGPASCRGNFDNSNDLTHKLISLILKHMYCFEDQIKNEYKNILILEDDADLFNTFSECYFNNCMEEFSEMNLDILFLGSCCGLHFPFTSPEKMVYHDATLRSRCTHCFVVTLDASIKIMNKFPTMFHAADWQLNHIIEEENLSVGWAEPSISQMNYKSSLNWV